MPSEPSFLLTAAAYHSGPPTLLVRCTFGRTIAVHSPLGWAARGVHGVPAPVISSVLFAPNVVDLGIGHGLWAEPVSWLSYDPAAGTMEDVDGAPLEAFADRPVPYP